MKQTDNCNLCKYMHAVNPPYQATKMAELGLEDGSVAELGLAGFVLMVELGLDESIFHPN